MYYNASFSQMLFRHTEKWKLKMAASEQFKFGISYLLTKSHKWTHKYFVKEYWKTYLRKLEFSSTSRINESFCSLVYWDVTGQISHILVAYFGKSKEDE